jgi:amidase
LAEPRIDTYATAMAGDLAQALARREIGALEMCDTAIATIEARDGPINAVVVRDFDRARDQARAADAALARGESRPLLGVPMTVKESHNVAGLPTSWGAVPDFVAREDAVGIRRLKAAGAVILGKTNVPPWLGDWQSANPIYGRTGNPHDLGRTPGGSSGGAAAALAAGMVPLEYGSDLGGSIRVPAHFCGVYGHKTSYGVIPGRGHVPPGRETGAPLAMAVVGPLARSAEDLALALDVLAGPDDSEAVGWQLALPPPRHHRLADCRVLILDEYPGVPLDSELRAALDVLAGALEAVGAQVSRDRSGLPDLARSLSLFRTLLMTQVTRAAPPPGPPVTAHEWMNTLDAQAHLRRDWARLFEEVDVVLAPPFGTAAFPHLDEADFANRRLVVDGQETPYHLQGAWSGLASAANLPATVAPIGRTTGGLPIGVQIIGPYLGDRTTIGFAGLLARELGS